MLDTKSSPEKKYGKHRNGLYCDDGLASFVYTSGPEADRLRKDFIKIFKEDFDLSITCERICHLRSCNPKSDKW